MSEPTAIDHHPAPQTEERRAAERQARDLQLLCQPGTGRLDQFWWVGSLKNISPAGLGLMTRQPFDPGTILALEVKTLDECNALPPEARVVHATPLANGRWLIGCVFRQPMNEDQLQALVSD